MLKCSSCDKEYSMDEKIWRCECGGLLDIKFKPFFPKEKILNRLPTMWRYREALPIKEGSEIISLGEGFTPLVSVKYGDREVYIKQDHLQPSGSFKDRGASLMLSTVNRLGIKTVVEDSSGNAGSSISAYSAAAGVRAKVFVPHYASEAKLKQIEYYGADLTAVKETREDAAKAAFEAAQTDYYVSHAWNPFFIHGVKTFAYEIAEQLDWTEPDTVLVPVGNGTLLLGTSIGFDDLLRTGVIKRKPKIIAIQPNHCAPLADAFDKNLEGAAQIDKKVTIAEGLAVARPARAKQILAAVRESGGKFIKVGEQEIKDALYEMITRGFFIEPSAAATIAGLKKYLGEIKEKEIIVSTFTGHGLKSFDKTSEALKDRYPGR